MEGPECAHVADQLHMYLTRQYRTLFNINGCVKGPDNEPIAFGWDPAFPLDLKRVYGKGCAVVMEFTWGKEKTMLAFQGTWSLQWKDIEFQFMDRAGRALSVYFCGYAVPVPQGPTWLSVDRRAIEIPERRHDIGVSFEEFDRAFRDPEKGPPEKGAEDVRIFLMNTFPGIGPFMADAIVSFMGSESRSSRDIYDIVCREMRKCYSLQGRRPLVKDPLEPRAFTFTDLYGDTGEYTAGT